MQGKGLASSSRMYSHLRTLHPGLLACPLPASPYKSHTVAVGTPPPELQWSRPNRFSSPHYTWLGEAPANPDRLLPHAAAIPLTWHRTRLLHDAQHLDIINITARPVGTFQDLV